MIREKVDALSEGAAQGVAQPADPAARDRHRVPRGARRSAATPLPDALRAYLDGAARRRAAGRDAGTTSTLPAASRASTSASSTPPATSSRSGRDLAALRAQLGEAAQLSFAAGGPGVRAQGAAALGFRRPAGDADGRAAAAQRLTGYPALVDDGDSVVARAARHARSGRRVDARRRRPPDRLRAEGCARRASRRARPAFAQAALQLHDDDPDRRAAGRRARGHRRSRVHRRRSAAARPRRRSPSR